MGCGFSKSVAPSRSESLNSVRSLDLKPTGKKGRKQRDPCGTPDRDVLLVNRAAYGDVYSDLPGQPDVNPRCLTLCHHVVGLQETRKLDLPYVSGVSLSDASDTGHHDTTDKSASVTRMTNNNVLGYNREDNHNEDYNLTLGHHDVGLPETRKLDLPYVSGVSLSDTSDAGHHDTTNKTASVTRMSNNNVLGYSRQGELEVTDRQTENYINGSTLTKETITSADPTVLYDERSNWVDPYTVIEGNVTFNPGLNSHVTIPAAQISNDISSVTSPTIASSTRLSQTDSNKTSEDKEFLPCDQTASLRKFMPLDVTDHNRRTGWREWSMYRGKVYDNNLLKTTLTPLIYAEREKYKAEHGVDLKPFCNIELEHKWCKHGVFCIKLNGLKIKSFTEPLSQCCIGVLEETGSEKYWSDVRRDVKTVLTDLLRDRNAGDIYEYAAEYMHLLQRWITKYKNKDPEKETAVKGDPNVKIFPLSPEVNPDTLRSWLSSWEEFVTELPEGCAWSLADETDIEQLDAHQVFTESLRVDFDTTALDFTIEGEAGWEVIEEGLVANDEMTDTQWAVFLGRNLRSDLGDEARMKRRRLKLLRYFKKKYEMTDIEHYLNWADGMKQGEKDFLSLCESGTVFTVLL